MICLFKYIYFEYACGFLIITSHTNPQHSCPVDKTHDCFTVYTTEAQRTQYHFTYSCLIIDEAFGSAHY